MMNAKYQIGDTVQVPLDSKKFGRIATQNAKNVILQKIREEERKALYNEYYIWKRMSDRCCTALSGKECER